MDFQTSPEWRIVHTYRLLIELGEAPDFTCPACHSSAVVRLGPNDEPAIKCNTCEALTTPGIKWYTELQEKNRNFLNE